MLFDILVDDIVEKLTREWLSPTELLILAFFTTSQFKSKTHQYVIAEIFSKHQTSLDIDAQSHILDTQFGQLAFWNQLVSQEGNARFMRVIHETLRRDTTTGYHLYKILNIWSQSRFSMQESKINYTLGVFKSHLLDYKSNRAYWKRETNKCKSFFYNLDAICMFVRHHNFFQRQQIITQLDLSYVLALCKRDNSNINNVLNLLDSLNSKQAESFIKLLLPSLYEFYLFLRLFRSALWPVGVRISYQAEHIAQAIPVIISKLDVAAMAQELVEPLLATLEYLAWDYIPILIDAFINISIKFGSVQTQPLADASLRVLQYSDQEIFEKGAFILGEIYQKLESRVLKSLSLFLSEKLAGHNYSGEHGAMHAIPAIISQLDSAEEMQLWIPRLFIMLGSTNEVCRSIALKAFEVIIRKLNVRSLVEQVLNPLFQLYTERRELHIAELIGLTLLQIDDTEAQPWITCLVRGSVTPEGDFSDISSVLVPLLSKKLSEENIKIIIAFLTRDTFYCANTLANLKIFISLYPDYPFNFAPPILARSNATLLFNTIHHMYATIRSEGSLVQSGDKILRTDMERILSSYRSNAWWAQCLDKLRWMFSFIPKHQSRAISELNQLLHEKKAHYSKEDIENALRKDSYAQHRLGLFSRRASESKIANSATDDIVLRIGKHFNTQFD